MSRLCVTVISIHVNVHMVRHIMYTAGNVHLSGPIVGSIM